jgi:uncharacterized membrane protein HdeD (DUF308 family)
MATSATAPRVETGGGPAWAYALLGVVFVIAGIYVLGNLVAASVITAWLLGFVLLVAGAAEVIHAFYAKNWGGFAYDLLIGLLYLVAGFVLVFNPLGALLPLTLAFGILVLGSGIVRIVMAFRYWAQAGWLLLLSGLIGVGAGVIILSGWPMTGLWVLGLVVGIDLLSYGVWWIAYAITGRHAHA